MNIVKYARFYGFFGVMRLLRDILVSRCCFPGIRIIRYPFYVRGRGHILFGKNFTSGVGLRVDAFDCGTCKFSLIIGDDVQVNDYVHIGAAQSVKIGDGVLIASKVYISDHNHGAYGGDIDSSDPLSRPAARALCSSPVIIEDNVWIGESVAILPGVTVGEGCIVGANSVVTRSLPPYTVCVGSPAVPVKKFDFEGREWRRFNEDSNISS